MDIYNIKTYFKCDNQKKAIMQAIKYGISKQKFFEMKKEAGFTNWTFEKRKYKKELLELEKVQDKNLKKNLNKNKDLEEDKVQDLKKDIVLELEEDNNIIFQDNNEDIEDIEVPYITWTNIEKIE
jgi:uncharacterized protein YllA (UPF0747 family)